jgi:uncharacterized protein (TIGR03663 family)
MTRPWLFAIALTCISIAALASRVPRLADRPMHQDEAIHADKFHTLWHSGKYEYNPIDYHGPTLNYFTLPIIWATGTHDYAHTTEATYRIVPVLFSVGLIALLWFLKDALGPSATLWAALLCAVSPAMSFYSRYYIQEMLLIFFTFGAIVAGWRYSRTTHPAWCITCGVFLGLMYATKETWVISIFSMAAGLTLALIWTRIIDGQMPGRARYCVPHLVLAGLSGAAVAALFFSGFFTHARGPLDAIRAYTTYFTRGGGTSDHNHPWNYYLNMLLYWRYGRGPIRTESFIIILAALGAIVSLCRAKSNHLPSPILLRFLTFYTFLMTLIYAAIPYKTPWCMLGFLHGLILLAGVGAAFILRVMPHVSLRWIAAVLLLAGSAHLARQTYEVNYVHFLDIRRNPYLYGHPSMESMGLVKRINDLAAISPQHKHMRIRVITSDCWPLPWYLRAFDQVEYWDRATRFDSGAAVIIASKDTEESMAERFGSQYQLMPFGLRPYVVLSVYVERGLWEEFLRSRAN